VPENSAYDFADNPTAISRVYNFSSQVEGRGVDESGCDNCKQQRDEHALFTGQVILTDYLIERITQAEAHRGLTLASLDQEEVVEYLKTNLHWRITDVGLALKSLQESTNSFHDRSTTTSFQRRICRRSKSPSPRRKELISRRRRGPHNTRHTRRCGMQLRGDWEVPHPEMFDLTFGFDGSDEYDNEPMHAYSINTVQVFYAGLTTMSLF
jgi:hypothetical protein